MGIAIDSTTPAFVAKVNSFGTTNTTASFTPPSGSLLVACAMDPNGGGDALTISDNLGTHLNWTSRISVTGTGVIQIWVADVVTSAAMTVTATVSNNRADWGLGVIVVTGALPVSGQSGATVQTANTTSVPTATIGSLVGSNSLVVGAICDVTSATAPTVGTGQSLTFNGHSFSAQDSTNLTGEWVQYLTGINLSAGSSATINDTAPTADTNKVAVVEILAVPPPTVTSVSPSSGSTAGGTPVIIGGQFFTGATAVKFGTTNATSFTVVDDAHILATSPSGSLGTVNVTVTNAVGTSSTSSADDFTYATADTLPAEYGGITFGGWYYASVPITSSSHAYTQSLTGNLIGTGAALGPNSIKKGVVASLIATGSKAPTSIKHGLTAALVATGSVAKQTFHALAGSLKATGAVTRQTIRTLTGNLVGTGARGATAITKGVTGTLQATGAQTRAIAHGLTGSLVVSGNVVKQTIRTLTGNLLAAGAVTTAAVHHFTQTFTANLVAAGAQTRQTLKSLTGSLVVTGALQRSIAKTVSGTLRATGAIARVTSHGLAAALAATGAVTRKTAKTVSGSLEATGALTRRIAKGLAGVLRGVGNLIVNPIGPVNQPPTICYPTTALIVPYASAPAFVPYASAPTFSSYTSSTNIRSWSTVSTVYSYGSAGTITGHDTATTFVNYTSGVTHFNTCDD